MLSFQDKYIKLNDKNKSDSYINEFMNFFARMLLEPKLFNDQNKYDNYITVFDCFIRFMKFVKSDILETAIVLDKLCAFGFIFSNGDDNKDEVRKKYLSLFYEFLSLCSEIYNINDKDRYSQLINVFLKYLNMSKVNTEISFNLSLLLLYSKFHLNANEEQTNELKELVHYFTHLKKENNTHLVFTVISDQLGKGKALPKSIKYSFNKINAIKRVLLYILVMSNANYQINYHLILEAQNANSLFEIVEKQLIEKQFILDNEQMQLIWGLFDMMKVKQPYQKEFTQETHFSCVEYFINMLIILIRHFNFLDDVLPETNNNNYLFSLNDIIDYSNIQENDEIIDLTIKLFNTALLSYTNPFIFSFLSNISQEALLSKFINSIFNFILNKDNLINPIPIINIGYFLVYLFKFAEKNPDNPIFYSVKFIDLFDQLLELLKETNLILTKFCFPVYSIKRKINTKDKMEELVSLEYSKTIIELVFDFFERICRCSNNEKYIIKFVNYFFIKTKPSNEKESKSITSKSSSSSSDIDNSNWECYSSLMFFVDSQNYIYTPKFYSRYKIEELNQINLPKVNFNNVTFFFIKSFSYRKKLNRHCELYKNLNFLWRVLYKDFCVIYKKNSKSRRCYQSNESKSHLYNQTNNILRDLVVLKGDEDSKDIRGEIVLEREYSKYINKINDIDIIYYLTMSCCIRRGNYYTEVKNYKKEKKGSELLMEEYAIANKYRSQTATTSHESESGSDIKNKNKTFASYGTVKEDNNFLIKECSSLNSKRENLNELIESNPTKCETNSSDENKGDNKDNKSKISSKKTEENSQCDKSEYYYFPETIKVNSSIRDSNTFILSPKRFILSHFPFQFIDLYFSNELFKHMKQYFFTIYQVDTNTKKLDYPSKVKNFSNGFKPFSFLKQDLNFFDSKFFNISHEYYNNIPLKAKMQKNIIFHKKYLPIPLCGDIFNCEKLIFDNVIYGHLGVYDRYLSFWSSCDELNPRDSIDTKTQIQYLFSIPKEHRIPKTSQLIIFYSDISYIISRRFLLMWQAIEIHCHNGKSYFFNLFSTQKQKKFLLLLKSINSCRIINDCVKSFNEAELTDKWRNKEISTYDYLLKLNFYSSRSFIDTNQYPVFPWLTNGDIENTKLNYRDFSFPISMQTDIKRKSAIEKYKDINIRKFKYHSGNHYSTSSFVFYYLMRILPYTNSLIQLQNFNLENANRMFSSFSETKDVLFNSNDNRELIPEIFCNIETFINLNCAFFGKRSDGKIVDDLKICNKSNELSEFASFIIKNRKMLNSIEVFNSIPKWINNIFGVNQLIQKPESCNVFCKETYENKMNLETKVEKYLNRKMPENEVIKKIDEKITVIINFGSTPHQILKKKLNYKRLSPKHKNNPFEQQEEQIKKDCIIFDLIENNTQIICVNEKREVMIKSINFFNDRAKKYKMEGVLIPFKLFHKIKKSTLYYHLYNPKLCMIYIMGKIITCRHLDNTIKIYSINQKSQLKIINSIKIDDFAMSICKIDEASFLIGLVNGKIIKFKYDDKQNTCIQIYSFFAHQGKVSMLYINSYLGIMLSCSDDSVIYIRKLIDFEMLQVIKVPINLIVVDAVISSCNFVYIMSFDSRVNQRKILGYTVNGILFAMSDYGDINSFQVLKDNDVIVGDYYKKEIWALDGGSLKRKEKEFYVCKEDGMIMFKVLEMQKEKDICLIYKSGKLIFIRRKEEIVEKDS